MYIIREGANKKSYLLRTCLQTGGGAGARVPPCPQHIFYFLDKDNSDMHPNFVGKKKYIFCEVVRNKWFFGDGRRGEVS